MADHRKKRERRRRKKLPSTLTHYGLDTVTPLSATMRRLPFSKTQLSTWKFLAGIKIK